MHRVRTSLPYFNEFGWDVEVVTVDPRYTDIDEDQLLCKTVPENIPVHYVKAFNKSWTKIVGLGSLALRSMWFYNQKVKSLLRSGKFDLIYFSTTQFPVCILGASWKRKYNIPFVIDFQDPWYSDYYQNKPKSEQPSKYWFSYRLNKFLEPIALRGVGGLISVSPVYIDNLKSRYPELASIPAATIPFGYFAPDFEVAKALPENAGNILKPGSRSLVYVGRGGADMHRSLSVIFNALANYFANNGSQFPIRVYFIGTSYAPKGLGEPTILPLARQYGLEEYVTEITDRMPYYQTLNLLKRADALLIPGSDDPAYNASKILPYILSEKPVLAVMHPESPGRTILKDFALAFNCTNENTINNKEKIKNFFDLLAKGELLPPEYPAPVIQKYSARTSVNRQCEIFESVINAGC